MFGRKKEAIVLGKTCPKCGMEFADAQRMMRYMLKAHKKRKIDCNTCGFRN